MKYIKPWIVPKRMILKFCEEAYSVECDLYVKEILTHDRDNYLVVTNGSYPFAITELEKMLEKHKKDKK